MAKTPNVEDILTGLDSDTPDTVSDADLASAADQLRALIDEATGGDDPDVDLAEELVPALERVTAEQTARADAATARAARAAEIRTVTGIDQADTEDADAGDGDPAADVQADDDQAAVPVAAATIIGRLQSIAASRAPAPDPVPDMTAMTARAVGPAAGHDGPLDGLYDAADVFSRFSAHVGRKQRSSLIRLDAAYPEARRLGEDADTNTRRLDAVLAPRAVTAAGGICDPLEADYTHPICGDRGRPVRDALPRYGADRGGIRFAPSPSLADVAGGITHWTAANDANPGTPGPDTKACPKVTCPTEVEATVDAMVACLTVGNYQARFNPEFWASRLDLLMVAHDRSAENALIAMIDTHATAVTYGGSGINTVVDVLHALDRAVAGIASRHRIIGGTYRALMPDWIKNAWRSALVSNQSSNRLEAYAAADAALASWMSARNINPVYSPDTDPFGAQAAGALDEFPGGDVVVRVWPEGTFAFLDGGVLDLGTEISDSTLNKTNDRQAFMETFEGLAMRGCEALAITIPTVDGCVCNDVATAAP